MILVFAESSDNTANFILEWLSFLKKEFIRIDELVVINNLVVKSDN